jgi:ferritin
MDISIEDICRQVMELERATTESLYNCKKVAIEEGNLMVIDFLDKLILEQIEEEASSQDIFQRVAMCNGNPVGILLLDNQF